VNRFAILLAAALCTTASAPLVAQDSRCFTSMIAPGGWSIPQHGKMLKSGRFTRPNVPEGITFTDFALNPQKQIGLPRHYIEAGALVLLNLWFRADGLTRLDVKGKPFAYLMYARGVGTGDSAEMWWLDRDGNGTFTELQWNPDFGHLPDWVAKLLTANK
jgi:hypothetical protein